MQMHDEIQNLAKSLTDRKGHDLYHEIVNKPFGTTLCAQFDVGTIVLLLNNTGSGRIERVALSDTPSAKGAVYASAKPFHDIHIPNNYKDSAHVKALKQKKPVVVTDWADLFVPALSEQQARDNQAAAGITCSVVYPFFGSSTEGTIIFSLYCEPSKISQAHIEFFKTYSDIVASRF